MSPMKSRSPASILRDGPVVVAERRAADEDHAAGEAVDLAGRRVHFVGIGGCGMSGLAMMARQRGAICTGSDLARSDATAKLEAAGVDVVYQQTAASLPPEAHWVVTSAAVKAEHPELAEARRRGLSIVKYAQMLGRLMLGRVGVAIAGTHGKSSTTSMLGHVLVEAGLDPSVIVGAHVPQLGGGSRTGRRQDATAIMLAEACEYDRSFHHLHPTHAAILNIEADHLDLYSGIDEIVESFAIFARRIPEHGSLLIEHDSPHRERITDGLPCRVETIGFEGGADWRVSVERPEGERGRPVTRLAYRGEQVAAWASPLPGRHMAYNAAAAAVMAHRLGAGWREIEAGLAGFAGLERRMQVVGERAVGGEGAVTVIDDYGHHPTEVAATLRALREHYPPRRLVCVFQPHQHSRTRHLMEQFADSFTHADGVIVPPIYFVRDSESERQAVTAEDLVLRLCERGVRAQHIEAFDDIVAELERTCGAGDLVVTMGAGDVWRVGRAYLAGVAS